MNYYVMIGLLASSLLQFAAIFIIYFPQKRLHNSATVLFEILLFSAFITVIVDFISYLGVYNPVFDTKKVALNIYEFYSIFVMLSFYLITNYCYIMTYGSTKPVSKIFFTINALPLLLYLIVLVILLCTNSFVFYDRDGKIVFSQIPSWWMLISQIIYFTVAVVLLLFFNAKKQTLRFIVFTSLVIIEFSAIIYVTMKTYLTLTSFFLTYDILLLFVTVQYPKSCLDKEYNCFDARGLTTMFNDYRSRRKPFYLITIQIIDYRYLQAKYGHRLTDKIIHVLCSKMPKDIKDTASFKYNEETFVTLTTNYSQYLRMIDFASTHLTEYWTVDNNKVEVSFRSAFYACDTNVIRQDMNIFLSRVLNFIRKANTPACINIFDIIPMMEREAKIISAVRDAIKNNSFLLYIQPIWSLKQKRFEKGEVLVRLVDETLGFIPPDEFVKIAEEWQLVKDISHQVIEKTLYAINKYNFKQYGVKSLNINLSSIDLSNEDIFIFMTQSLEKYQLPYSCLTLEVTETAESECEATINTSLAAFHEKGFSLALDDYGTGYSNMERILSMPFDYIKIDKNMLHMDSDNKVNKILLRKNIEMLKECGYKIVVEGVEKEEQVNELEKLDVDYIQGYYYAKPMPLGDFIELLKEKQNPQST